MSINRRHILAGAGAAFALPALGSRAFAATTLNLSGILPETNFQTRNAMRFSEEVSKATGGDVIISVKAYVDVTGTVIGAVPLRQGDPLIDELGVIAAESVMNWRFEPARDRGVKVPGQTVVRVPFSVK